MTASITVFGQQGSGKTRNAEALRQLFKMRTVWDEGKEPSNSVPPEQDALILTTKPPKDFTRSIHIDAALHLLLHSA